MIARRATWLLSSACSLACAAAAQDAGHLVYGQGCYDVRQYRSVYQRFATAAESFAALQGTAVTFTPNGAGDGYVLARDVVAFLPPTPAAQLLALGDDDDVDVALGQPFPHVAGAAPTLSVCSNGFVSVGPSGLNPVFASGSVASLLNAPLPSFRSNTDLDPTAAGGVYFEQFGSLALVTFQDVARFNAPGTERFQFQFDLAGGVVAIVWDALTPIGGAPMVVGYGAGGPSSDCGGVDLATELPFVTGPDLQVDAVGLSAAPAPVSTATSGTLVTYTIHDVPDVLVDSGLRFGAVIVAFTGDPVGLDLAMLGAAGCRLYVGGLDLLLGFVDTTGQSTLSVTLAIPPGVPPGTELFAQAAPQFVPNTLPNGLNALGAVTSNGVRSTVGLQ